MTKRWWLAFALLILTTHELHELAHVITARSVCGVWATRDFNSWLVAAPCASIAPMAAGPLFSYVVMALGAAMILRGRERSRSAGAALVFAANPFARLFTTAMGGGDELVVAKRLANVATATLSMRLVVLAVVAAICVPPIVVAWRAMRGPVVERVAALLAGIVVTGVLLMLVGNRLLHAGVLARPMATGAPLLVELTTLAAFIGTAVTSRWLFSGGDTLSQAEDAEGAKIAPLSGNFVARPPHQGAAS